MDPSKFREVMEAVDRIRDERGVMIDGRKYSMVKDRVEVFRRNFGDTYGIDTDVRYEQGLPRGSVVVAIAKIINGSGVVLGSGWATEIVGQSSFSDASPIEMAETSAIGRALASFGLHGGEYASGNEIQAADRRTETRKVIAREEPRQGPRRYETSSPTRNVPWFIPAEGSTDVQSDCMSIAAALKDIGDLDSMARYWSALGDFKEFLENYSYDMYEDLERAFSTRAATLKGLR